MAYNTLKERPVQRRSNTQRGETPVVEERVKGTSIFHLVDRFTRMDVLFQDGVPVRFLPVILYIGNTHYAEKTIRKIDKIKIETEDLRADYTTLKSDYMEASKQSEVGRKVAPAGLVESSSPPYQIEVYGEEY